MCTVTAIPAQGKLRLACNRDELRSRLIGLPPHIERFGRRRAILPIDPASGGTWVAVNNAGMALTLLNANLRTQTNKTPERSRGTIIPSLLHHDELDRAIEQALFLESRRYASFRLVLATREELAMILSDGQRAQLICRTPIAEPLFFTSSGLGDHLVEGPRQQLFAQFFGWPGDIVAKQDAFHRHRWPDHPELSVCMSRSDARTVSHTVVLIAPEKVTLAYHADAPDQPASDTALELSLNARGAS